MARLTTTHGILWLSKVTGAGDRPRLPLTYAEAASGGLRIMVAGQWHIVLDTPENRAELGLELE